MDRITHPATRRSLDEYAQIRYLDPSECCFKKTEGGFLSLSIGEKEQYERVDLVSQRLATRTAIYPCVIQRNGSARSSR